MALNEWVKTFIERSAEHQEITITVSGSQAHKADYRVHISNCAPVSLENPINREGGNVKIVMKYTGIEVQTHKTYLTEWLNATLSHNNDNVYRNVNLVSIGQQEGTAEYLSCFITKYIFPVFNTVSTAPLKETVVIKPNRRSGF